jgi:hypothetical protein
LYFSLESVQTIVALSLLAYNNTIVKITKHHLCGLPSCYAASHVVRNGRILLLLAPDAPGPCYAFDSQTFKQETAWKEPGGTMSMVALPGRNGDFLAVQRFFPGFQAQGAEIVWVRRGEKGWQTSTLCKLPYVHRFDTIERGGVQYLLCGTLCSTKNGVDDWTSPGGLYAAELPDNVNQPVSLTKIAGGMTRNHGYWRVKNNGYTSALTSCDQGVFEVQPPAERGGQWTVTKVLDKPVSDIALGDIDGDGIDEMATIGPFHGNRFCIYKRLVNGRSLLYQYPGNSEFLHVVWGGKLRGENVFIGGCRGGNKELFLLHWRGGEIVYKIIEAGAGPANVCVINGQDHDLILAANHESGEGAVFIVRGEL